MKKLIKQFNLDFIIYSIIFLFYFNYILFNLELLTFTDLDKLLLFIISVKIIV
jgi:hypothetical protein